MWWQLAIADTWENAPIFGVGFGYDIAAQFSREYFADMADDFTARSPHSIFVTVFARMGLVGITLFLAVLALALRDTWVALRARDINTIGTWAGAWQSSPARVLGWCWRDRWEP